MATNGLLGITSVANTGSTSANIWAKKLAPVVVSPLSVVSPDGTKTGSIAQNDNGNMIITSDPSGSLYLGNSSGQVYINDTDEVSINFLLSAGAQLQVVGQNLASLKSYNSGNLLSIGSDAVVNKGSGNGILYDTQYNPTITLALLNDNTTGNITYDNTASRVAGVYQVQLSIESTVPATTTFLTIACSAPPSTSTMNFSGAAVNASAVSVSNQDVALNTGFFTHAGGNLRVVVQSSGAAWTGTWSLQLVKMG